VNAEPWLRSFLSAGCLIALAACSHSPPPPPVPHLKMVAQEQEQEGTKRYAQGEMLAAQSHFAQALNTCISLDDATCADRNRIKLATASMALKQYEQAQAQLTAIQGLSFKLEAALTQAQVDFLMRRPDQARQHLAAVDGLCDTSACVHRGAWLYTQARLRWALLDGAQAQALLEQARAVWAQQGKEQELANAWRLSAVIHLQTPALEAAKSAAQSALELDRRWANPPKIAQDWLLLGDIDRSRDRQQARAAYQKAWAIAHAAGLQDIESSANTAISEVSP
jgi:tetratricopeptide (TPR) repeat protein